MANVGYYDPNEFGNNQMRQPLNGQTQYVVRDPYGYNNDDCCC